MTKQYQVHCDCGAVSISMSGSPKVHAFCHCEDCRNLLDVPYHSIVAWEPEHVQIESGKAHIGVYEHPTLEMTRVFCKECGETVYNTNAMGWKLVSQLLIRKYLGDELPADLRSNAHFFYDRRIVNIEDQIPKYE